LLFHIISAKLCPRCPELLSSNLVPTDFHLFNPLHLAILTAVPVVSAGLTYTTRRYPAAAHRVRIGLAALVVTDGLLWYGFRYFAHGIRFPEILPLELCDASFWLTAAALLTLQEHIFELSYYWGIAGSGMALVTPYLRAPLNTLQSLQYFTGHALLIVGVFYLLWSGQSRPRPRSWLFAWWALNLYGVTVALVDFFGRTNFMYLRQKPASSSLFNLLGPWPFYIAGTDVVALILFWLLALPVTSVVKTKA
jgi:hypothetical integral membrane protein (TIGR02206 family)